MPAVIRVTCMAMLLAAAFSAAASTETTVAQESAEAPPPGSQEADKLTRLHRLAEALMHPAAQSRLGLSPSQRQRVAEICQDYRLAHRDEVLAWPQRWGKPPTPMIDAALLYGYRNLKLLETLTSWQIAALDRLAPHVPAGFGRDPLGGGESPCLLWDDAELLAYVGRVV